MGVQAGDKFIIQIGGILTDYTPEHKQVYRVKGFNSLVFDEEGIKRLTPLDDALTSYQKVGRALCEWADDAFLTDYEEACDWLSAHMKDTPLQVLPPEKGMIEKYIDLAVKLKRDINITMDQDGRIEMTLSIPSSFHTVTDTKPASVEDTCEMCRWYEEEGEKHCQSCMHNHISFFEREEKSDEKV